MYSKAETLAIPRRDTAAPPTKGKENPASRTQTRAEGARRAEPDLGATYLGVDNFVPAESAGLAEAFATDFTHKRSSSGVDRHVAGEVIVSIKHLQKDESGTCVESTKGLGLALEATIYIPQPTSPSEPRVLLSTV